jgi:hypothetical protein
MPLYTFKAFVLICSMAISHQNCIMQNVNDETIRKMYLGEGKNELSCFSDAMVTIARSPLQAEAGKEYTKLVCVHERIDGSERIG